METGENPVLDLIQEYVGDVRRWDFERKQSNHLWFKYGDSARREYEIDLVEQLPKDCWLISCTMLMTIRTEPNQHGVTKQRLYQLFNLIHDAGSLGKFSCTDQNGADIHIQWSYQIPRGLIFDVVGIDSLITRGLGELDDRYSALCAVLMNGEDGYVSAQEAFDSEWPPFFGRA